MTQRTLVFDAPLGPDDMPRLSRQLAAVKALMATGEWYTKDRLRTLMAAQGIPCCDAGVSARIRDLRKKQYGGYTMERRNIGSGLFEYRMS